MKKLNLGNVIIFPGNQLVVNCNGLNIIVKWGLPAGVGKSLKLYCKTSSFKFYKMWKPCLIEFKGGYFGGITNGTNLLVYTEEDYTPKSFESAEIYLNHYKNNKNGN